MGHGTDPSERKLPRAGIFARFGEVWTVGLDRNRSSFRDLKGFHYIQRLLQHPGQEFHALDLLSEPGTSQESERASKADLLRNPSVHIDSFGDAGEMLDGRAKEEYRRKLHELREELDEQRERGNAERAGEIEQDIKFVSREISRAVGLGGRDRRAGSTAERARLSVTRAIRTALEKIGEHDKKTAGLLDQSVRTGIFCRYVSDPAASIAWRFTNEDPGIGVAESSISAAAAPAPSPHLTGSNLIGSHAERTTFIGRDNERAALRSILEQVRAGSGRVVTIAGAPGVGKTRIAVEFARQAEAEGVSVLTGACYDRDDAVPFIPFVEIFEAALAQAASPQDFRSILGGEVSEIARLMPQIRRLFPDVPPSMELPPEQTQRMLFAASAQVLIRLAADRPLLLVLDDLHWADEGTLALLNQLVRSISKTPMMILGTYRDNELDLKGPLTKTLDELTRMRALSRLNLEGLNEGAVGAMIEALSGSEAPGEFVKLILSATEGNPFFIEVLFRHLLERGKLFDKNGNLRRDLTIDDIQVPESLRVIIGRRLPPLRSTSREMLGVAAVIGPSFAFELLEASMGIDPDKLLEEVEKAEDSGLLLSSTSRGEVRFQFSHELIRQAVLAEISAPRLQRLHLDVANAIEKMHPDFLDDYANDLAHHLSRSGNAAEPERTVNYLAIAGKRALRQSSYQPALQYLRNALHLLNRIPNSPARAERELELQMDRGIALLASAGWHVVEYLEAASRARDLCLILGKDDRLSEVLFALRFSHLEHGDHRRARQDADEIMRQALKVDDAGMLVAAYWAIGSSQFFMGEFGAAHITLEKGIALYDFNEHRNLLNKLGQDPCMACLCHDAQALWTLGYPDRAEQRAQQAFALSKKIGHSHTLAYCLSNLAVDCLIRHEYSRVLQYADEGLALSRKYGLALAEASLRGYSFAAQFALGKRTDRARLREIALRPLPEYQLISTCYRSTLAEAFGEINDFQTGFTLITQAYELMERNDERFVEPELHRIRGELILKEAATRAPGHAIKAAQSEAESNYRMAIEVARTREARMFELRATISLGRLLMATDRREEAAERLESCYGWFSEGFNCAELETARSLLTTLGKRS